MAFENDELDFDALSQITAGTNYLTPEEEAKVYTSFSGDNASKMVDLLNQKRALEQIKQEESKNNNGGRNF